MSHAQIEAATRTYEYLARLKRERHVVHFPKLYEFSQAVRRFARRVQGAGDNELWDSWTRDVKRLRFLFTAIPLPTDHEAICSFTKIDDLRERASRLSKSYPTLGAEALNIVTNLEEIVLGRESPLLEVTCKLLQECESSVLVIGVGRLVPYVEKEIRERGISGVDVTSPNRLRRNGWYQQQIVIGTRALFQDNDYIFSVPKARVLRTIHFEWINPDSAPEPVFPGSSYTPYLVTETVFTHDTDQENPKAEIEFIPGVFESHSDLDAVIKETNANADNVTALAFLLETDQIVLLEKGSRTLVIDLESPSGIPVRRVMVEDIESGMFVLVRTDTHGDYIQEVADRLLGPTLRSLARLAQADWKNRLRARVRERGIPTVARELRAYGCGRASPHNVRNWISSQAIATQTLNDFRAIMSYLGAEKLTDPYWKLLNRIRRAHMKAGQAIRKELVSLVKSGVDRDRLDTHGQQDFSLHAAQGVKLSAIRVRRVIDREYQVNPSRLGQLLEV